MAPTILVTGASGFIGAHVIEAFLHKGYNVRAVVRSERSAEQVRKSHPKYAKQLSFAIVPDMIAPNAFDEAVQGVDGVMHLASPFVLDATDFENELFQPAIQGTTSVLKAVKKNGSSVSRVVITSSFAAVLDPLQGLRPGHVYTERDWNPVTRETASTDGVIAYLASKTFAEQAAWKFVEENKPSFSLTTLLPPMVYGPLGHHVENAKSLNTSSADIYRLIDGSQTKVPDTSFWAFADVRELADAHVAAYETPQAAGQRYLIANSSYSYQQMADIIRDVFPEYENSTPKGETGASLPPVYRLDTSKATKDLGIKWRPLRETVTDTVNSLKELKA